MNFPYHTESIPQHEHHLKPIKFFLKKKLIIFREGGVGGGHSVPPSIFEPFPNQENHFVWQRSQPPLIVQIWFCIQNVRMDLSFQETKNYLKIEHLVPEIFRKKQSKSFWDTL